MLFQYIVPVWLLSPNWWFGVLATVTALSIALLIGVLRLPGKMSAENAQTEQLSSDGDE